MLGSTVTALTACSAAPGRLDLFVGDGDGGVWHRTRTTPPGALRGRWGAWHSLGRPWPSPGAPEHTGWLTAVRSGPGRIELLALDSGRGTKHRLFVAARDGALDTLPEQAGTEAGDAAGAEAGGGAGDVVGDAVDDVPGDAAGHGWTPWTSPDPLAARPSAPDPLPTEEQLTLLRRQLSEGRRSDVDPRPTGFAATERDLFAVAGHRLWHRMWTESTAWEDLGGDLTTDDTTAPHLAAVRDEAGSTHVFAVWAGTALMHRQLDRTWSDWQLIDIWSEVRAYQALRPDDLVALTVRGSGLRERVRADGVVEFVAAGTGARLIVEFPPQHIAETVSETGTTSQARIAGPSRLAFAIGQEAVPLTVDGVLTAMRKLPLVATPETAGADTARLELPWRLLLQLPNCAHCTHHALPAVGDNGTTELWHSRITRPDGADALRVRPIKALPDEPALATPLGHYTTTIAALGVQSADPPVTVDRLILSAFGAWFDASASWPTLDWTHQTAMGRDYYVRVLTRGALFPFGHRAALIEVTERRFARQSPAVAALRTTRTLIVTEPTRRYGIGDSDGARRVYERAFPFQEVSVEPRQLTGLDTAVWLPCKAFWPKQSETTVEFTVRARTDREVVDFRLPMLFVDDAAVGTSNATSLDSEYAHGPRSGVDRDTGRPAGEVGRKIALAMKTTTQPLDGAIQEVRSMSFGGVGAAPAANGVGFHPRVTGMEVALPAVRQLIGSSPTARAEFSNTYLTATGGQRPEVLLTLPVPKVIDFAAAGSRTGMVAAPNMAVTEISRLAGPIAGGPFPPKPQDMFGEGARLFGTVSLRDIVSKITSRPQITLSDVAGAPSAKLKWSEYLTREVDPFHPKTPTSKVSLEVLSEVVAGRPRLLTTGEVTDFTLEIPTRASALVVLTFTNVRFTGNSGETPSLTFELADARLAGKLRFVKTLAEKIPQAGRGGPHVETTAVAIRATYTIAVPTLAMGVFSVQNLAIRTGLTLSLEQRPIEIDFAFAHRERPFLVTVGPFGGGGYLELGVSAGKTDGGLQRFVGGIEFGACVALDFGVATGEVHVFGGVVFVKQGSGIEITGYLRIGGSVSVLGLIRVSVELTLSLTYDVERNVLHGSARLVISVDLTFWSTSVTLECRKSFAGPSLAVDPRDVLTASEEARQTSAGVAPRGSTVEAALGPQGSSFPWQTYCRAFAKE
ncbi:hypothetical protein BN159_0090 [Streptomyces davaonensis JCM 4913]|uniref:Uncharacterized protein n=1 Tax=Streptomyces davaonensis (strain DSM 101723 / JCM 4913 / KCC S-0913 / 768) TaxID=1214101 RepID=K4QVR5_STRDJ|nr:hypothetical protein [Streptomyces davaonensis]CCK24469.1 hypothetical protein BN159_0090 [Streptomyces davaonensis JCM 4913]